MSRALLNRASLHLLRGDAAHAVVDLTEAIELLRGGDAPERRARAAAQPRATPGCSPAISSAPCRRWTPHARCWHRCPPVSRAVGDQDRAEVLTAAGRATDAIRALESAASAYGDHGLRNFQAECELTLSRTLLREDTARARLVARRAARRFRAQGSEVQALRADSVATVAEISEGSTSVALLRRADDLVVALKAHHHRRDAAILQLQTARLDVAPGRPGGRPRPHRQGPRRRGLAGRHPAAVARGALRARARPRRPSQRASATSAPDSPTCTRGSRRSAASTSRAPSSATAAPWPSRDSDWPSRTARPPWPTSGPSAPGRWSAG